MSVSEAKRLRAAAGPEMVMTTAEVLAAAQVEATLAVAEQLRIASITAIAERHPFVEINANSDMVTDAFVETIVDPDGFKTERLRPEVAEALGLATLHKIGA